MATDLPLLLLTGDVVVGTHGAANRLILATRQASETFHPSQVVNALDCTDAFVAEGNLGNRIPQLEPALSIVHHVWACYTYVDVAYPCLSSGVTGQDFRHVRIWKATARRSPSGEEVIGVAPKDGGIKIGDEISHFPPLSFPSLPPPSLSPPLGLRLDCAPFDPCFSSIPRYTHSYPPHTSEPLPERMVAVPRALTSFATLFSAWYPEPRGQRPQCDLSGVTMPISPAQQTALGAPSTPLAAVGLGFGVQNYTCSSNNVFVCVLV